MQNQWVIWLLITGVAYVSGSPCDYERATTCYSDLVHYESLSFPLYGENQAKLDDICGNINMSFDCIVNYAETCDKNPECDAECKELASDSSSFSRNTGLKSLAVELCDAYSKVREIYLENYECLESNSEAFSACHNDSQLSLEYLDTINDTRVIPLRCCYFSWYHDCFVNVTRDNCGENATFFVSFAMHKLVGHISDLLCKYNPVSCDRPPLPPSGHVDEVDKEKPVMTGNDLDNSIDDDIQSSATITNHAVVVLVLSYCFLSFFKMLL